MSNLDPTAAMQLLASRSPQASREAVKTIRRLTLDSPMAERMVDHVIGLGLADPEAELSQAERDALAALLSGATTGRTLDLRLRVTAEEKRRVQTAATKAGLSVSDFIRQRIGLA